MCYIIGGLSGDTSAFVGDEWFRTGDVGHLTEAGVPDAKFGERAHAFIVLRPGSGPVDLDSVRGFFDERRISRFKTPEYVTTVPHLPRNSLGKVQKHLLVADLGPRID